MGLTDSYSKLKADYYKTKRIVDKLHWFTGGIAFLISTAIAGITAWLKH